MANNLKALREARGLSQDALAQAMGTTRNQLAKLESGARRLSDVWIDRASKAFQVDPADLVRENSFVAVLGLIGASEDGASVTYGDDTPGILGFVRSPFNGTKETVALEVRGASMRGLAENGWFVFYDQRQDGIDDRNLGELCVVGLSDGRTLIKEPHRSRTPGLFDLESHNASTIRDVEIAWSAPVTCIVPRRYAMLRDEINAA